MVKIKIVYFNLGKHELFFLGGLVFGSSIAEALVALTFSMSIYGDLQLLASWFGVLTILSLVFGFSITMFALHEPERGGR
jgi:hypothetical protein